MLSSDVGRWTKVQKQLDATVCHDKLVQRPIHACMCVLWTTPLCAIAPPLCLMPIKHLEISIWKYEEKWQWKPFWNMFFFFFFNCQMALFILPSFPQISSLSAALHSLRTEFLRKECWVTPYNGVEWDSAEILPSTTSMPHHENVVL